MVQIIKFVLWSNLSADLNEVFDFEISLEVKELKITNETTQRGIPWNRLISMLERCEWGARLKL